MEVAYRRPKKGYPSVRVAQATCAAPGSVRGGRTDSGALEPIKTAYSPPERLCHRAERGGVMVRSQGDRVNPGKWGGTRSGDVCPRPPGPKLGPVFPPCVAENRQFGASFPVNFSGAVSGLP